MEDDMDFYLVQAIGSRNRSNKDSDGKNSNPESE